MEEPQKGSRILVPGGVYKMKGCGAKGQSLAADLIKLGNDWT